MYNGQSIIMIALFLIIVSFIVSRVLSKIKISNIKIMLLGISIIVFSDSVLKGMVKYAIDTIISIIGFSFCIVGFLKSDK